MRGLALDNCAITVRSIRTSGVGFGGLIGSKRGRRDDFRSRRFGLGLRLPELSEILQNIEEVDAIPDHGTDNPDRSRAFTFLRPMPAVFAYIPKQIPAYGADLAGLFRFCKDLEKKVNRSIIAARARLLRGLIIDLSDVSEARTPRLIERHETGTAETIEKIVAGEILLFVLAIIAIFIILPLPILPLATEDFGPHEIALLSARPYPDSFPVKSEHPEEDNSHSEGALARPPKQEHQAYDNQKSDHPVVHVIFSSRVLRARKV